MQIRTGLPTADLALSIDCKLTLWNASCRQSVDNWVWLSTAWAQSVNNLGSILVCYLGLLSWSPTSIAYQHKDSLCLFSKIKDSLSLWQLVTSRSYLLLFWSLANQLFPLLCVTWSTTVIKMLPRKLAKLLLHLSTMTSLGSSFYQGLDHRNTPVSPVGRSHPTSSHHHKLRD